MAYVPEETHHHYIDRGGESGAGIWAIVAVLVVLLALLLFGWNLFGDRDSRGETDINIRGNIETP